MNMENKSAFAVLLDELDTMQKSFPTEDGSDGVGTDELDDKKIQAAADGDRDGDGEPDGTDPDATIGSSDDEDDDYDEMAKAWGLEPIDVEVDGKKQKAYDGLQVLKAMSLHVQATEGDMTKALTLAVSTMQGMSKQIAEQAAMVKSLQEQVSVIGDQGKGRRAVLSVLDKSSQDNSVVNEGLTPNEVMSKAMSAQKTGAITGVEVARLDSYVGRGIAPPVDLLNKIGITA